MNIQRDLLKGMTGLRNPPWKHMQAEHRLLHACLIAYRTHAAGNTEFGWSELGDILCNAICETVGDKAFQEWNDAEWDGEPEDRKEEVWKS